MPSEKVSLKQSSAFVVIRSQYAGRVVVPWGNKKRLHDRSAVPICRERALAQEMSSGDEQKRFRRMRRRGGNSMRLHVVACVAVAVLGFPAHAQDPAAPAAPAAGGAAALVAGADPVKGQAAAKKCVACHTFEEAGSPKVGPNLWGIVGRPVASVADYKYSEAMIAHSQGGSKIWTIAELDPYLLNPKQHVPGTKMAFPGIKKDDERANVIAYLATLGGAPKP
jgi:cytochrome c2